MPNYKGDYAKEAHSISIWLGVPKSLYARGVVVETGDLFFAGTAQPRNHLRIGYSSIAIDRIEPGVRIIAEELILK